MIRRRSGILSVLACLSAFTLLGAPNGLAAQEDGNVRTYSFSSSGRPRIGVTVDPRADKENDRLGARVQAVTPDGPAAKAGLVAGDIITKFNGVSLGGVKGDDEDDSGPAQKLIELARKLEPGDTVNIEYRRGGDTKKAKLVAQDLNTGMARRFRMQLPRMDWDGELPPPRMPMMDGGPGGFKFFMDDDGMGLHMADLNPELGEYFGTKEGVLLLETPKDSTLALKAGDVILSIDGRAPTSEAHARRILRSYDGGETAKLEILRKQKKLTVSWKVPEREREWKRRGPVSHDKMKVEKS
jgi:PDZ domain